MKALIEEYGQACAARALAVNLSIGHGGKNSPLAAAAIAREAAALEALEDARVVAAQLVSQALGEVDRIATEREVKYSDDPSVTEGYRANFERAINARRAFSLKDARPLARHAAKMLRTAWDMLDPSLQGGPTNDDIRAALSPCNK